MAQLIFMGIGLGIWLILISLFEVRAISKPPRINLDWPSYIDDVGSGVRAGLTLPAAVFEAGVRLPEPAADVFQSLALQWQETGGFLEVLDALKSKFPEPGFQLFADTAGLAFVQGGRNVPTVLTSLAQSLRARKALQNDIAGRQSTTINSARVAVIAPLLVLLLTGSRAEVRDAYSNFSGVLVLFSILLVTLGSYWLMRRTAVISELELIR